MVCTPSNEAADRCCEMLTIMIQKWGLDLTVVRMLARSKEKHLMFYDDDEDMNPKMERGIYLHEMVVRDDDWLNTPELKEVANSKKFPTIFFYKKLLSRKYCDDEFEMLQNSNKLHYYRN